MASGENPFSAMVDVIREEVRRGSGPSWDMGEVVSVSPLKVRYRGVQLNADQVAAAGQWAAQLKVGDSVPVLPDRDDGRFAIMQPADSTAFASAEHDHDEAYSAIGHDHDEAYSAIGHDHDEAYSAIGHDHDEAYSAIGHDHSADYLPKDDLVMTLTSGGNANTVTKAWILLASNSSNLPTAHYYYVQTARYSSNKIQLAYGYNTSGVYYRRYFDSAWTAWTAM